METPLLLICILVTGILAAVFKGAEKMIREHQSEWIDKQVNSLSNWLDTKRPLRYTTLEKGRNMLLYWAFVVIWDGRLFFYGIKNDYFILTILAIILILIWLVMSLIFRRQIDRFELVQVKEPKFRLKLLTSLRANVHNFFLRWYQILISRIMLSEKSGGYVIKSIIYQFVVFPFSLFVVLFLFIYLVTVIFTALAIVDSTALTNPFLIAGIITTFIGAVILIFFWQTLWFLFWVGLEANVIFWSALLVLLIAVFSLLVRILGQAMAGAAYNAKKGKGAWEAIVSFISMILACISAILGFIEVYLKWGGTFLK